MDDYLQRRDEEDAEQTKEPAEDRNKEDQDKATGEDYGAASSDQKALIEKMNRKKKRQKQ